MWVDVALLAVSFVDYFEIAPNFAFYAIVGLTLHLALLFLLLGTPFHVLNRESNQLNLLVLCELLGHESVLLAGDHTFGGSLLAGSELLLAQTVIKGLLLL